MKAIQIGDFEVIESGAVTSIDNKDVLFVLSDVIRVRLTFKSSDDQKATMNAAISNGELTFTLINFNNPLGTEFTDAIEIGTYQGRKLFLHIRVIGMNNSNNKVIIHTWYLGNSINDG